MAWQLARLTNIRSLATSQTYKKPVAHREKLLEEKRLHYKNEANSIQHTHMVSHDEKKYLQKAGNK